MFEAESNPNPRPRGQATREEIIATAKRLFSEHGYHATGLSDIQAATGLTKGAFYHHFSSKEDLALAVLENARCEYLDRLITPAMEHPSPAARIAALLDRVLELNSDPAWRNCQMMATLCAELTVETGRLRDAVQQMQRGMMNRWSELIRAAQEAGEIDPKHDPLVWGQWIMQTLMSLVLMRKLGAAQVPPSAIIEQIKRTLLARPTGRSASRSVRKANPKTE